MTDRIRVRLVPKNKEGDTFTLALPGTTAATAKKFAPDAGRARAAQAIALSEGIEATVTARNAVEGQLPSDQFDAVFGVKLTTKRRESREYAGRGLGTEEFLSPEKELSIPPALQDTIAFAYVPTPPEFVAPAFVPPNVGVYHLRLSDVVRALLGGPCHRLGWTGRGVRVAMADTGFARHPYFDHQGYSIERVSTPSTSHPAIDTVGHGTGECANALAIAPDIRFFGIKHNDYSAEALETSLAQNPQVFVNSWGWDVDKDSWEGVRNTDPNLYYELRDLERIISDAIDDGVTVIFAAGNGHRMFPACMPEVIAVGGTTVESSGDLKASSYASSFRSQLYVGRRVPNFCGIVGEFGDEPMKGHIMLPVPHDSELEGENLPLTQRNKGWGIFSGTSAAAPQVAGVSALMLSVNPNLTPAEISTILADTAVDVTKGTTMGGHGDTATVGVDDATGSGLVNAFGACLRVHQQLVGSGPT